MAGNCRIAAVSVVVLTLTATAAAQTTGKVLPLSIRVTGEASVTATLAQADIDIDVITRGDTGRRAGAANAEETARVLAEMKRLIGPAGTITTIGYSVHPEYGYPREGPEPQISAIWRPKWYA